MSTTWSPETDPTLSESSVWTVGRAKYVEGTSTSTEFVEYEAGIENGYLTSTTLRPFVNVGEPLSSTIDNYRLMCFDLLDYQKNSTAPEYAFKIYMKDQTSEVLVELINTFTEAYNALVEYTALCVEQCSFNSDTGQFNDFFRENIVAYYEDDIAVSYTHLTLPTKA